MRYYKNVREGNTIIHETFATKKKKGGEGNARLAKK